MKKLLLTLTALLAFAAVDAQAQYKRSAVFSTSLDGGTNVVAASTTATPNLVLDVPDSEYVALHFGFASVGTNDSTITVTLKESLDNSTYQTATSHSFSVAANGTTAVNVVTNITMGAVRYLKLTGIDNPNGANALTNVTFSYSIKR